MTFIKDPIIIIELLKGFIVLQLRPTRGWSYSDCGFENARYGCLAVGIETACMPFLSRVGGGRLNAWKCSLRSDAPNVLVLRLKAARALSRVGGGLW